MNLIIIIFFLFVLLAFATEIPVIPTDTGRTCPPGEIENGNTCVPCPDGTFRSSITSNPLFCTPCPIGFASNSLARGSSNFYTSRYYCRVCSGSYYQDLPAQSTCKQCPPNAIYSTNSSIPNTNCPEQCPSDTFVPSHSKSRNCEKCPAGFFLSTNEDGRRECNPCPSGTYTDDKPGSRVCKSCPPGSFPTSRIGPCLACKPGYFATPGFYSCTPCTAGFYQPNINASSCLQCPTGSTSGPAATYCNSTAPTRICSPGSFLNPTGTCEQCPPGTISPGGTAMSCSQCPAPSLPDSTAAQCRCEKGFAFIGSYEYQETCVPCPLRSITDGITCSCPAPLYLDTRRGDHSADKSACACPPGQRYDGIGCVTCEAGAVPGEGDCDFCGPRAAVDPETGRCVFCGRRRGGPTFNETCKCPEGYFYFTKASTCVCARGSFPGLPNEIPEECQPCSKGERQRGRSCVPKCANFQSSFQTHYWDGEKCVECESGSEASNGRCLPFNCGPRLRLNFVKGICECQDRTMPDGTCQDCRSEDGLTIDKEKNECVCQTTHILKDGACVRCPAGFTKINISECAPAPCPGKRYKPEGEQSCSYCAEASEDIVGATACVKAKCKDDEFETEDGSCEKCKAGQRMRNKVCVDCAAEEVSPGGRRGYCSKCGPGSVPNAERSGCVPS